MTDYTPDLHLPLVAPNQNQKEATINTALAILESAANDSVTISLISGNLTLNDDQYTKYFHHQFVDHLSSRIVTLPATRRWFAVENLGSGPITFKVTGSTGLSAELPSGKIGLVVSDGVDVRFVVPDPTGGLGLLRDLSDVDGIPTDGQLLRWYATDSQWKPWTFSVPFKGLNDVPSSYVGQGGKLLAIRMDENGVEYVSSAANINSFVDLDDTPGSYSGSANFTVKVNSAGTGLTFALPRLTEAADFPSNYTGAANKLLRVNSTANGVTFDVLKVVDLSDGPGAPTAPNALRYIRVNAAGDGWEYATGTGGPDHFTQLEDTPDDYMGKAKQFPRVNDAEDGLIFSTVKFIDLADGPGAFTGSGKKFLRINTAANAIIYDAPKVEDLADGPGAPAPTHSKKVLRVNQAGNGVEYITLKITDLGGFPTSFTGQGGKYLIVKGDETGIQFTTASYTTSFLNLTDVPAESYAGLAGRAFVVDPTATGLIPGPIIPTRLGQLADVEDGTGTPQQGDFLRWIDGVWQADPFPVSGGGGGATELAELTDVEIAASDPPQDGQVLGFSAATGKWTPTTVQTTVISDLDDLADVTLTSPVNGQIIVYRDGEWVNEDPASQGVPSNGSHTYWRLLLHATDGSIVQYGIQEIQFKQSKFGPDLANGGTPSASTDEFGTVGGAFDNVISGAWFSTTAADGQWIKYQFPTPAEVRYMTIQGSQSQPDTSPSAFSVQWSDNDADWTTAWEVTGQTGWAPGQTREFHAPIDLYFTDLADAPQSYIGQAAKLLRVKGDSTGLEFFSLFVPTTLGQLSDVEDGTGTPLDGYVLTYKDGVWQAEPPAGGAGGSATFTGLLDTPDSYAGEGGNALRVKMDQSGLEFYTPSDVGGGGSDRGEWGASGDPVTINFEDSLLGDELTFDASGFTVVTMPDVVGGTTKALKFRPITGGGLCYATLVAEDIMNIADFKVRYKVSSEGGFDFFRIILDGGPTILTDSGNTGAYEEFSYTLAGDHAFRFQYSKDGGVDVGDDTVYISKITYTKVSDNPYVHGDTVTHAGSTWFCLQNNTTEEPGAGDDWIAWGESSGGGGGGGPEQHAPHQGWRVLVTESQTGTYATLAELKFYDRSGTQVATTGGKIFDTNAHGTYPTSQAFDGNTATYWSSLQQTSTDQFGGPGYIFATDVDVGSIKITTTGSDFNTTNSPKNFALQYTDDDGASWKTFAVYENQTSWGVSEERTFVVPEEGIAQVGGSSSLATLTDVDVSPAPTEGQVLTYNDTTDKWEPRTPASGGGDALVDPGYHTYWRVKAIAADTATVSIAELRFYRYDFLSDMSGGTPIANNTAGGSDPVDAFDTNNDSAWISGTLNDDTWVGYQFTSPVKVTRLDIRDIVGGSARPPSDFLIQYADETVDTPLEWKTSWAVSGVDWGSGGSVLDFAAPSDRIRMANLADVIYSGGGGEPNDGDVLIWQNADQKWIAGAVPAPALGNLADVYTGGAMDGYVLTYQSGGWVAAAPTGGEPTPVSSYGAHEYWRLSFPATQGSATNTTIGELTYSDSVEGSPFILDTGNANASSVAGGNNAANAFDGDFSTAWRGSSATNEWLSYHFDSPTEIMRVFVGAPDTGDLTEMPSEFIVQYSDDDTTYTDAWTVSSLPAWSAGEARTFVDPNLTYEGGSVVAFTDLSDVPSSYAGKAEQVVRVNASENALEFVPFPKPWDYKPPLASDFTTLLGTVSLTLTDDDDIGLMVDCGQSTFGDIQRIAVKSLPVGDWTVTIKMIEHLLPYNYNGMGLILRESSTGKITMFGVENNTNGSTSQSMRKLRYSRLPGLSGFTLNPYSEFSPSGAQWYRLSNTGGILKAFVSTDGKMWRQIYLESSGASFTSGPDQVGIGCSLNANYALNPTFSIPYWDQSF